MNASQQALEQACVIAGLDSEGARLLRLGSNAVYHLKSPVIVRVARPGTDIVPVRRAVAVARWLESADYPAVRAIDIDQPVIAHGYVVTFWQSVSDDGDQFASTPEIAAILARLHRLTAPEGLHLPPLDPFASAVQRLGANTWLTPVDRAFLTATLSRLQDAWEDPDVAMFFLGKALGAIAPETTWGQAKGLFWGAHPMGMALVDTLRYLADTGILEQRDDYGQYRWAGRPASAGTGS